MIDSWFMTETGGGARDNEQYAVDTGSSTTGDTYSYGAAGSTDRALGGLRSGTLVPVFGANFTNDTGGNITDLLISYFGEQWRLGTAARTDRLDFQISYDATSLTTGTWIDVNTLDFTTPDTVTVGAKNGNTAADRTAVSATISGLTLADGATFWIRWTDLDASGADDGLAVDDFSLTPTVAPGPGRFTVDDVTHVEGNAGTTAYTFTVNRLGGTVGAVSVNWSLDLTDDATASANDFTGPTSGTVTFAASDDVGKTFTILVNGDTLPETDEFFRVLLDTPTGGAGIRDGIGIGTITNDDGPPIGFSINDVSMLEGNSGTTAFTFTVSRNDATQAATVQYNTLPGTATAGSDYVSTSGALSFGVGELSKTVTVQVVGDNNYEADETFRVRLSNPTGGSYVIIDNIGVGTIQNDDLIKIHEIQGNSYFSPVLFNSGVTTLNTASSFTVTVQAVVTAIDNAGARQGFFITEETGDWDANNFTSEGIFVMTRNDANVGAAVTGVQVGDLVTVIATIMEYQGFATNLPMTVLINPVVTVNSSGNTIPVLTLDASHPIPNQILTGVTPELLPTRSTIPATASMRPITRCRSSRRSRGCSSPFPTSSSPTAFIVDLGRRDLFQGLFDRPCQRRTRSTAAAATRSRAIRRCRRPTPSTPDDDIRAGGRT